jgi:hypothetical protein
MAISNIFNKFRKGIDSVNCQEAYNIWDLHAAIYQSLEKLHIWQNYTHDNDLKVILNHVNGALMKIVNSLEEKCNELSLPSADVGVKAINTSLNTEVIRDELISKDVFLWLQGIVELLLRSIRTTTTNDPLRKLFIKTAFINLGMIDEFASYLRSKGWINVPLKYRNIPKDTKEDIDAGEAFHLWDHLTFRYDNIHQTEIYKDLANDVDLKFLFTTGLKKVLEEQAEKLEKECLRFGIPLPKKTANVVSLSSDMDNVITDDYMYRVLYIGIIGATIMHAAAVKQSLTNDRIRKLFIELLHAEIEIQDKFIVYGKMKGYLNEPPQY